MQETPYFGCSSLRTKNTELAYSVDPYEVAQYALEFSI